jgi:hypothetical protein
MIMIKAPYMRQYILACNNSITWQRESASFFCYQGAPGQYASWYQGALGMPGTAQNSHQASQKSPKTRKPLILLV